MPESETETATAPARQARVLVVDDLLIERRVAGRIVEKVIGEAPDYAGNGKEALERIATDAPSAVLTDLQMPGMDGLALVKAIRAEYPHVPVILMTAQGSEQIAMAALQAGAASYVPKRSLARDLAEILRQVLNVSATERRRRRLFGCLEHWEAQFLLENERALHEPLVELLQDQFKEMGLGDSSTCMRVGIALAESLSNALYHGNLEVSSDLRQEDERRFHDLAEARRQSAPYRSRKIHVNARLSPTAAVYTVKDDGPGFDTSAFRRPMEPEDLMRVGGRGLLLMRSFMDEVIHNDVGNKVTLIKYASPGPAA